MSPMDERPVVWIGSAKRDLLAFLRDVISGMGYAVRFADAVYVLHAFQKKSTRGVKTAASDVALVATRLKAAQAEHERMTSQ